MYKKQSVKLLSMTLFVTFSLVLTSGFSSNSSSITKKATTGKAPAKIAAPKLYSRTDKISPAIAKQLLIEGNARYINGKALSDDISNAKRKKLVTDGQHPFAIIVSCSDSRVPPETIFDQGLGDLFVIRDAGNVIDPIVLGSIEYGAEHLGAPLIIVLGHEKCGAVKATVDGGEPEGSIGAIVEKIEPSFEKVKGSTTDINALYENTADENILNSISTIEKSPVIQKLIEENKLEIVGGKYHIETGKVEFDK